MNKKALFHAVNQEIPRLESIEKVTGAAKYTDDINMPNMAYAALIRSPYSRAKVVSIDASSAEKVAGFLGICTPEEAPSNYFNCSGNPPSPLLIADELILTKEPKQIGDRVAIVAAETEAAAYEAAAAVHVEYEVLRPYLEISEALKDGAAALQPHVSNTNVIQYRDVSQGDRNAGETESDVILEDHYATAPMQHAMMELTSCTVDFSDGKHITCYSCSQTIFQERRLLSEIFGLREKDVRIIKPTVGGGFGARQQLHAQHAAALISRKIGRPVRLSYRREEEFYSVARHGSDVDLRIGASKKDGKLKLFDTSYRLNGGPYTTHTPTVVAAAARKLQYNVPNYFFHGVSVYTDHVTGGAFRGYGNSQLTFGREILIDRIAEKVGQDPVTFRLNNHVQVGEFFPCASIAVSSNGIEKCAARAQQLQREIDEREPLIDNDEMRTAWGVSFCCHGSGPSSKEGLSSAVIILNDDASVQLLVGSSDIGQGSETMEVQICAEMLGIPLDDVHIKAADTALTPYDTGTFGSSQTFICGNAIKLACKDLKEKLLAQLRNVYSDKEVDYLEDSNRFVVADKEHKETICVSFQEAARKVAFDPRGCVIIGSGTYKAQACPNPFAVCFVKMAYYKKINAIRLLDIIEVVDVGTPINRLTVQGQIEGGIAQGIGWALYEKIETNVRSKRTHSTDLLHYRIPQMGDVPRTYVDMVDSYDPFGACGAKSVGELTTVPVAPAIVNAARHASGRMELNRIPLCETFAILPGRKE